MNVKDVPQLETNVYRIRSDQRCVYRWQFVSIVYRNSYFPEVPSRSIRLSWRRAGRMKGCSWRELEALSEHQTNRLLCQRVFPVPFAFLVNVCAAASSSWFLSEFNYLIVALMSCIQWISWCTSNLRGSHYHVLYSSSFPRGSGGKRNSK